jgi:ribosomal protein L11 methyltransferase
VLALAALRLGARHADALDTDALAVAATSANAQRNGLADRVDVREGSLPAEPAERHALVIANLVAAVLVDLAPRLAAHVAPGGRLIAGGIIDARAAEVIEAMGSAGLAVITRRDADEWVTLALEHRA